MLNLGFRAHDFGKFNTTKELAQTAESFLSPCCLHFAPNKVLPDSPKPLTTDWAQTVRKDLSEHNVNVAILGIYINPVHPDSDIRENEILKFENGLDVASFFGEKTIVATETGSLNPANIRCEETWSEKNMASFMNTVERLLKRAETLHTVMALEAVSDKNTIDTPQRMLKVMQTFNSPYLRVLFDAVNILPIHSLDNFESWYDEALSMLSPYISCMHIKDFVMADSSKEFPFAQGPVKKGTIPVGEGIMPWKMLFKLYGKYNLLDVPMTLENFNPQTLKRSIEFVQDLNRQC